MDRRDQAVTRSRSKKLAAAKSNSEMADASKSNTYQPINIGGEDNQQTLPTENILSIETAKNNAATLVKSEKENLEIQVLTK